MDDFIEAFVTWVIRIAGAILVLMFLYVNGYSLFVDSNPAYQAIDEPRDVGPWDNF